MDPAATPLHGVTEGKGDEIEDQPYRYRGEYRKTCPQYLAGRGLIRYSAALRHLIPVRTKGKKKKETLGVDESGLFSFITLSWLTKYMTNAYKKGITMENIPNVPPLDSCDYNAQRLEVMWQSELVQKGPGAASLKAVVWKFVRTRSLLVITIISLNIVTGFISVAFAMRWLIEFAETPDATKTEGITWAMCLGISELLRVLFYASACVISCRSAVRLRAACLTMLYRKVIRLHSLGDKTVGELVNMFANDGQRIFQMVMVAPMLVSGPVCLVMGALYILWLLSPWALLGMTVFLLFYPIQYGMSRLVAHYQSKVVEAADRRISLMSEILDCIKLIKMYAWEKSFAKSLFDLREKELQFLQKAMYYQSLTVSVASTIPIVTAIVMFLIHLNMGYNLTSSQAFSTIAFCKWLLVRVLIFTSWSWKAFYVGVNSINRLQSVMLLNEISPYVAKPMDKTQAVCISNGTFSWDSQLPGNARSKSTKTGKQKKTPQLENSNEETLVLNAELKAEPVLHEINLFVPKGSLIGVCGQVGAGKSSLLSAAMGHLTINSGKLAREGTCAYVSQQSWILNATLKDNVLFGESFNANKYYSTLRCCALNADIDMLPGGDETEIGERGINLSGGQKQRVALARALYADRDIYFLDDPLSAVDAHVGAHIFSEYILKALKNKSVVFVTHQIQFLNQCDEICVMKDGAITEQGSHDQLMSQMGEYASMVQSWQLTQTNSANSDNNSDSGVSGMNGKCVQDEVVTNKTNSETDVNGHNGNSAMPGHTAEGKQLIKDEEIGSGTLQTDTYLSYVRAAGGCLVVFCVISTIIINVGTTAFSSWWLAMWIQAGAGESTVLRNESSVVVLADNPDFNMYRLVYGLTIIAILFTNLIRGLVYAKVSLNAARTLHAKLFNKVIRTTVQFFETTPLGRVQNLFTKDMEEVDSQLPFTLECMLEDICSLMFAVLFICLVYPWFVVPLVLLSIFFLTVSKVFRVAVRDLKRLDNSSRAPVLSSVATTVQGLSTIHAFNKENEFINKFTSIFDVNSTCLFMSTSAVRWLAIRVDTLSVLITVITAFLSVFLHKEVSPAMMGLAIAYAATISGTFQYVIRMVSEAEARFISVERITSYLQSLKVEGGSGPKGRPWQGWPQRGVIHFNKVCLRYRPGLPIVLQGVSFKVKHAEKLGIVGRTGSGKTSLTVALFRLVEICEGFIEVDQLNIASLDLDYLRSQLTIIPQDPVLFSGSVRANLDPFGEYPDEKLWSVLEKMQLRAKVKSLTQGLDTTVGQGGDNFSVGERQLVCLTRALLRKTKILILDEATAAIDPDTEAVLQKVIREEFRDCTVLTIAHRIATVMDCDRVLVMEGGKVAELDKPAKLLENPNSKFSEFVARSKESAS